MKLIVFVFLNVQTSQADYIGLNGFKVESQIVSNSLVFRKFTMPRFFSLLTGLAVIAAAATATTTAHADTLVGYDFGTVGGNTFAATSINSGISASAITDGSLFNLSLEDLGYASQPVLMANPAGGSGSAAQAVTNNSYFTFTVTPNSSQIMDFTDLTFNAAKGGSSGGPRGYEVRSSVDGYAASLGTADLGTVRTTWTPVTIDLSAASFDALTSATTFRIYAYSDNTGRSMEFDDFCLNGTAVSVPEPTFLAFLLGGIGMLTMRRHRA